MHKETRDRVVEKSFLIRAVEERLLLLFQEGKVNGTVHTCIGQELIGPCAAEFLTEQDYVISNHRGHGHFLARNENLVGFFAEIMGRTDGICGGKGGSQHFCTKNHLSNGIQGGMTPIGAGIALALKIQKKDSIVVCFIGDGTLGQGIIYEAFNMASLWDLPIVYVLENNGIAQSTSINQTLSGSIKQRAEGFNLTYFESNTWDIAHLVETFEEATTLSRKHKKPTFIEIDTYRLSSHSKGDDNRLPEDIAIYYKKDLLNKEIEKNPVYTTSLLEKINARIDIAVDQAMRSPYTQISENTSREDTLLTYSNLELRGEDKRINLLIHEALKEQFKEKETTVMLGEDIEYLTEWTSKPYGGAFNVSKNLSEQFALVKNTPISEAAIVGVGTGLALCGMTPIVEIMFGDFLTLAFDQIYNHACKFYAMYNKQVRVPLIIRTPMGGKRGYGPTHSQSIEKHFLGITDLTIIALNYRIPPKQLYKEIFCENHPVLVIENKVLYTRKLQIDLLIGYEVQISNEKYPTLKISPQKRNADVTVVCYGELLEDVEKAMELAFEEEEILCEIICPTQINPIEINPILDSVSRTNRLLIVEEGSNIAAYSSEVVAMLLNKGADIISFNRLANNSIIPSSYQSELRLLPHKDSIFNKIKQTYYGK